MTTFTSRTGIYELRSIRYTAPSATRPGTAYTVTVTPHGWSCDCEASQWRKTRGKCWHIKAGQAGALGKPRVAVMPLPA